MTSLNARCFAKRFWRACDIVVTVLVLVLLLLLPEGNAMAQSSLGPLANFLVKGPHGPWIGSVQDGSYLIRNATDSSAIRYYHDCVDGDKLGV